MAVMSTVPAVLLALVNLGRSSLPSDVVVFDGPPTAPLPDRYLSVGYSPDEDAAAVDGRIPVSDSGMGFYNESYVVRCQLSVGTGDMTADATAAVRVDVANLLAAFNAALAADPMLGGVLTGGSRAAMGRYLWVYGPVLDGTAATVEFDVDVDVTFLRAS